MHITYIPDVIMLESNLPLLTIEDLCKFSIMNKQFRILADSNEIWKIHYLQTIQSKFKITEKSVHIFGNEILQYENMLLDSDHKDKYVYVKKNDPHRYNWLVGKDKTKYFDQYNPYNQPLRENCKFIKSI